MNVSTQERTLTASAQDFLGNPAYPSISYGGYRDVTRDNQPSITQIKEDLRLLSALGYKVIRTYDVHHKFAENTLEAIYQLKIADPRFEMYVMLGAWIDCKNSFTDSPDHNNEDIEGNTKEIQETVRLANKYPEIVKIIAVGNESMVHWATSYFVMPSVILKWVNYLQDLKEKKSLPHDIWITSSDNFASWGGGDHAYHNNDLIELMKAVDYISIHTYPFHDTHYNPSFWQLNNSNSFDTEKEAIEFSMQKSVEYAYSQYLSVKNYVSSLGIEKDIHIGETGWASVASDLYGEGGTLAADELKQALYYDLINELCKSLSISCFYFSAFDEPWKDATNSSGSENHFGLFTVDGKAKYALWKSVDENKFDGLGRNDIPVQKTLNGNEESLISAIKAPYINNIGKN